MSTGEPSDERRRLAALKRYEGLGPATDPAFEDFALLAAQVCATPLAMIALVGETRLQLKAFVGPVPATIERAGSFCAQTIADPNRVMEVKDATLDARFACNPLVAGGARVGFYAGAALVTPDGFAIGTLCVMDHAPRALGLEQMAALAALGRRAAAQLELGRQAGELAASQTQVEKILATAEKSRRALLSVLEDERQVGLNLRESEMRFREVVENIREVFWMTEVARSRVLYVSPRYEAIWGRPCRDLYDSRTSWTESIHEEDRARVAGAVETKQVLGTYDEIYRIVRPDGTQRWIRDQAFPVRDASGQVTRVVGVAEDITQRKELEEQFLRTQRLEAIGTLAAGIAHDLNNILAPMLMVTPLLKDKLANPHDAELLTMVEQGAQRGANIIKQLLAFSRGLPGERGPVQARHLLREMVTIMRETFPRDIEVVEKVPQDLWPITADGTQIHQVLMNLCVNARDAMRKGGRLTVTAENLALDGEDLVRYPASKPGPYVRLTIADTGTGIARENLDRIFEPFFTTKDIGKGTGLGLSTVIGIVKSHAGFVMVDSEVGVGSSFRVYLPADADACESLAPEAAAPVRGRRETILVVDDEEAIRQALRLILEGQNYQVLTAADGREAVTLFADHRESVRLVLTDLMMPGMNGVALIRTLSALAPALGIVAMSGLHDEERRDELKTLGVKSIIAKPCRPAEILEAVQSELQRTSV